MNCCCGCLLLLTLMCYVAHNNNVYSDKLFYRIKADESWVYYKLLLLRLKVEEDFLLSLKEKTKIPFFS